MQETVSAISLFLLCMLKKVSGREVDERTRALKGWQDLVLDHAKIGLIIGLDGRIQLVVFCRACPDILRRDMNVGMGLIEARDHLIDPWYPVPEGQVHRTRGGGTPTATTGSQGNHHDQCHADDGESERQAALPLRKGKRLHSLSTPL